MHPPRIRDRFRVSPTLVCNTVGTKYTTLRQALDSVSNGFGQDSYEIDAADLVHKLHTIGEQHTSAGLHIVANKDIPPLVFAVLPLHGKRLENLILFLHNLRVVWRPVVHVA